VRRFRVYEKGGKQDSLDHCTERSIVHGARNVRGVFLKAIEDLGRWSKSIRAISAGSGVNGQWMRTFR